MATEGVPLGVDDAGAAGERGHVFVADLLRQADGRDVQRVSETPGPRSPCPDIPLFSKLPGS
jgi:hypothetical protein